MKKTLLDYGALLELAVLKVHLIAISEQIQILSGTVLDGKSKYTMLEPHPSTFLLDL